MHHACRSKVRWVLNTAELRGGLGKEIAAGVFRAKQNCISEPRSSIDMHLGVFFLYVEAGRETRKVDWMCSCCRLTPWAETGGGLTLLRVSAPELKNNMRSLRGQITLFAQKQEQICATVHQYPSGLLISSVHLFFCCCCSYADIH